MKKILSFLMAVSLVATMLPWALVHIDVVPKASAAVCTISSDTDITATYASGCDGITVDTSSTLTFHGENLDMNGSVAFTVNEGVTVTWSGTGLFADSNDSIVINGTLQHVASGTGVILSASGNVTVGSTGSINVAEKGCSGGTGGWENGYGPNLATGVCAVSTAGYGINSNGSTGGGHGGAGGRGTNAAIGAIYGSSVLPLLLGSGAGAAYTYDGGHGGGKVYLNISGILTVDGSVAANGGNGGAGGTYGAGGGSGGSIYIDAGTLAGAGSVSANGGNGGNGSSSDGGGGGGGRIAVYYDTLSGFTLDNITATKGLEGGNQGNTTDGSNGTTFIVNETTDAVRVTSGLDFIDGGDYTRGSFTVDNGANLYCGSGMDTLTISTTGDYTDNGSVWNCANAITTKVDMDVVGTLTMTDVTWDLAAVPLVELNAATWTMSSGTNAITIDQAGSQFDTTITNPVTFTNLTYTGGSGGTNTSGGVWDWDDAIGVTLVNTDIKSSVDWDGLTSLNGDYDSSINADGKGCSGGTAAYGNGYGPNASTGVCAVTTTGYGDGSSGGAGGSHGGIGGRAVDNVTGSTYGSNIAPILLGSGGGGAYSYNGGYGGGKIYLNITGALTLNGAISAAGVIGGGGGNNGGGGGSGGSVYVIVGTLTGTGSVSANGGNGYNSNDYDGGGGAGGRIAIYYDTLGDFTLGNINSSYGTRGGSGRNAADGANGTTFILDQTTDDLRITSGMDFVDGVDYVRSDILIDSGSNLYCGAQTTLNIGASGTYTDNGSTWTCSSAITTMNLSSSGTVALTGVTWTFSNTANGNISASTLTTAGTNAMTFSKTGAQADIDVDNDMTLNNLTYTGSYGGTNTSGGLLTIDDAVNVDLVNTDINGNISWDGLASLSLDYVSSINADGKGCSGGIAAYADGYGPNASTGVCAITTTGYGDGSNGGSGGGHGGAGGRGQQNVPGATYGSNTAPVLLGSGGGGAYSYDGGHGGGKIYLNITGAFALNGALSADGADGDGGGTYGGGGASGGSIYVVTGTISGTGSLSSDGGNGYNSSNSDGGGGGGGRIAILYGADSSSFLGSMSTASNTAAGLRGGAGGGAEDGSDGTVYTLAQVSLASATITDTSGYTNDSTPVITLSSSGATPTHVAFSCDNSNWSTWLTYPDDDVVNDPDGPVFDFTTDATNCSTTEETKTIYAKIKDANGESSVVSDTTAYDVSTPSVSNVTASNANDTYGVDDIITVQVIFDESITKAGTPQIELDFDGTDRTVDCTTVATATLSCPYTIVSGDNTSDLAYTGTGALTLNGGAIGDLAGNTADIELPVPGLANSLSNNKAIVVSTNQDPTVSDLTVSQTSAPVNGVNIVNVIFDADDADDDDTLQAKIEYNVGTGWAAASIVSESITATTGTPVVDNSQTYQIGQASGYIETSSGVNTITSGWASSLNVTGADTSSAQVRVTPYDGVAAGTAVTSSTFTIDQVSPSGGFTETYTTSIDETSVSIGWDPVTTETNFAQYTVYYKRSSDSTYSSAGTLTTMSTSSSSITGLVAGVQYNVYVQAADDYGNTANSPVLTFTTSQEGEGTTSSNTASQAGGGSGSSGSSSSTSSDSSTSTSDSTTTNAGDSDQQAGESETGDEDYSSVDNDEEPITNDQVEEPPVEEEPIVEEIEVPVVVETEPEDYISAPLEETPQEEVTEELEEYPTSVGVFDEIEQEIYEDVAVITYEETSIEIQITTEEIEEKITEEVIESDKDLKQIFKDKDDDGIPDIWEETNLNDTDFDGTADTDGDGLTDLEEYQAGSDPLDADTDNDGLSDIIEVSLNLSTTSWDTDGDGISDDEEIFNNQDPTTPEQKDIDPVLYDEQNDSDGDGLSDYMEKYYNTDPYSADSDNDGIDDIEELFLDTNPNKTDHVEELDTKITNHKGTTSTSSNVLIRGTATEDPTIYIVNDKDEIVSTIEAEIDEEGKFAITNDEDLPDGEYKLLIATEEDFSTGTLNIDTTQQKEQPELEQTPEETQFTGKAEPNAIIYATWKSLILSSVIVADSQTGDFTLDPPSALEEGEHTVYVYTQDQETNTTSETLQVNFTITQSNVLHESAAQREADEQRTFPYTVLILLALVATGGAFIILKRGKPQHQEEQELIKKL